MADYQISAGFEVLGDFTLCPSVDLQQYFGDWLIDEASFFSHLHALQNMDLTAHFRMAQVQDRQPQEKAQEKRFPVVRGNLAMIDITGPMTKRTQSMGPLGTTEIRRQMRLANQDPDIAGIFLKIDSPGGTMAGTPDLANDVNTVAQNKPVLTYFEDMGASAAYFVGSQATKVRANENAVIGSIGTMLVVVDLSEMAEKQGIKVHVIKTGDFKAIGVPGANITEPQLEHLQSRVNQGNEIFLRAIARGREGLGMGRVRELADGKVHLAAQAAELGLIDGVSSIDAALDELVSLTSTRKAVSMSETTAAPQAATIEELEQALPGASADFVLSQVKSGATLQTAMSAFLKVQRAELEQQQKATAAAEERAKTSKAAADAAEAKALLGLPGNNPDETATDAEAESASWSADPQGFWKDEVATNFQNILDEMISQRVSNGMDPHVARLDCIQDAKLKAVTKADQDHPGLREAKLAATRPQPQLEVDPRAMTQG